MKTLTKLLAPVFLLLLLITSGFAQKNLDKDAKVTIKVNGKEQDIETYFEEWGEEFGKKMERMFDDPKIRIDLDDEDLNISFNNVSFDIDNFAESIADVVSEAVSNMTIELENLDPDDIDHNDFNFRNGGDLDDMIDEIENKYNSKVENIDKLKIKIREDYVKIDMDATLKNGKSVFKSKIYED